MEFIVSATMYLVIPILIGFVAYSTGRAYFRTKDMSFYYFFVSFFLNLIHSIIYSFLVFQYIFTTQSPHYYYLAPIARVILNIGIIFHGQIPIIANNFFYKKHKKVIIFLLILAIIISTYLQFTQPGEVFFSENGVPVENITSTIAIILMSLVPITVVSFWAIEMLRMTKGVNAHKKLKIKSYLLVSGLVVVVVGQTLYLFSKDAFQSEVSLAILFIGFLSMLISSKFKSTRRFFIKQGK